MRLGIFSGVILLAGFVVFSGHVKTVLRRAASPLKSIKVLEPMPDFTLPDREGREVSLKQVAGEKGLVLVNFWATWCGPCRLEMPQFEKVFKKHAGEGFAILAISEDGSREALDEYLGKKPVSFPVLVDAEGKLAKQLGIRAYPTSILIEHGLVIQVDEGVMPHLEFQIEAQLKNRKERKER
jgi:peroxiredoxin